MNTQLGFTDPLLEPLLRTLGGLLLDTDPSTRLYAESIAITMVHHLLHHHNSRPMLAPQDFSSGQLRTAIDYIRTYYMRDLSITDIAEQAGFSLSHFSRRFREGTGLSPHQYLIRCRVEKAYDLLRQGYSIAFAAHQVGFYDESHLIRHFKRRYQASPKRLFGAKQNDD